MLNRPPVPALNYNHPALRRALFATVVEDNIAAFELVGRQVGVPMSVSTTPYIASSFAGRGLFYSTANTSSYITYTGRPLPPASGPYTFSAIVRYDGGNTASAGIIMLGDTNVGQMAGIQISSAQAIRWCGTVDVLTGAVVAGGTYFIASSTADLSSTTSTTNTVVVDLRTGLIKTNSAPENMGGNSVVGTNNYCLGTLNIEQGFRSFTGLIHAVTASQTFMSLQQLMAWAVDPWGPFRAPGLILPQVTANAGPAGTINLLGVAAAPAAGTFGVSFSTSVPLTGVAAAPAAGAFSVESGNSASINLTGVAASPAAGVFTVQVPAETLSINNFTYNNHIFQYNSLSNQAVSVLFTGGYTNGPPTSIDVTVTNSSGVGTIVPYTALSSFSANNGAWSGNLTVPAGLAWYVASARDTNNHTITSTAQTNKWGVGIRVYLCGASNMNDMVVNVTSPGTPSPYTYWWNTQAAAGWNVPGGDGFIIFMNEMVNYFGCNVGAIHNFFGGAPNDILNYEFGAVNWVGGTGGTSTGGIITQIPLDANGVTSGDALLFLLNVGQNSGDSGNFAGNPTYFTAPLSSCFLQFQAVNSRAPFNCGMGVCISGPGGINALGLTEVRYSELIWGTGTAGGFVAASTVDGASSDGLHITQPALDSMGARMASASANFFGLGGRVSTGPQITSFTRAGTTCTFSVQQNSGVGLALTQNSSALPYGLEIATQSSFGAADVQITACNIISSTRFTVTLVTDPGVTCFARYLYGQYSTVNQTNNVFFDIPPVTGDTLGNPMEPTGLPQGIAAGITFLTQFSGTAGGSNQNLLLLGVG